MLSQSMPSSVLFLYAEPLSRPCGDVDEEERIYDCSLERDVIFDAIRRSQRAINFRSTTAKISNITNMQGIVPLIIHYNGHHYSINGGTKIIFESDVGASELIDGCLIRRIIQVDGLKNAKIAFINSRNRSGENRGHVGQIFADAGLEHVISISLGPDMPDNFCDIFTKKFYELLLAGNSVKKAFEVARECLCLTKKLSSSEEDKIFGLLPANGDHEVAYYNNAPVGIPHDLTDKPVSTCPVLPSKFIGRVGSIQEIFSFFVQGERCVTVVGAIGIGKTTLVQRFASYVSERSLFDYLFFVPFGSRASATLEADETYMKSCILEATRQESIPALIHFLKGNVQNEKGVADRPPRVLFIFDHCDVFLSKARRSSYYLDSNIHTREARDRDRDSESISYLHTMQGSMPNSPRMTSPLPRFVSPTQPGHHRTPSSSHASVLTGFSLMTDESQSYTAGLGSMAVLPGLCDLVDTILSASPATRILITSRTALPLSGHVTQKVVSLQPLTNYDAAELLCTRTPCKVEKGAGSFLPLPSMHFMRELKGNPLAIVKFANLHLQDPSFVISPATDTQERAMLARSVYERVFSQSDKSTKTVRTGAHTDSSHLQQPQPEISSCTTTQDGVQSAVLPVLSSGLEVISESSTPISSVRHVQGFTADQVVIGQAMEEEQEHPQLPSPQMLSPVTSFGLNSISERSESPFVEMTAPLGASLHLDLSYLTATPVGGAGGQGSAICGSATAGGGGAFGSTCGGGGCNNNIRRGSATSSGRDAALWPPSLSRSGTGISCISIATPIALAAQSQHIPMYNCPFIDQCPFTESRITGSPLDSPEQQRQLQQQQQPSASPRQRALDLAETMLSSALGFENASTDALNDFKIHINMWADITTSDTPPYTPKTSVKWEVFISNLMELFSNWIASFHPVHPTKDVNIVRKFRRTLTRDDKDFIRNSVMKLTDNNQVTITQYFEFLKWWLPVLRTARVISSEFCCTAPTIVLGFVTRERASQLLSPATSSNGARRSAGSFLIRFASGSHRTTEKFSTRPGDLVVCYSKSDKSVAQVPVRVEDGLFIVPFSSDGGTNGAYSSLRELIAALPGLTRLYGHHEGVDKENIFASIDTYGNQFYDPAMMDF